jgi:uncharacterized protein (TIGR00297 family)
MSAAQQDSSLTRLAKAIPLKRDRLQSRVLVVFAVPVLCLLAAEGVRYSLMAGRSGRNYLLIAATVSALFALAAWRMKAATPAAAACGGLICLDLITLSGRPDDGSIFQSGFAPLIMLFVLTHAATRFRAARKQGGATPEDKHGRNAAQVIANLGIAPAVSLECYWLFGQFPRTANGPAIFVSLQLSMLAALAEATADTVSSEVGQAVGGRPFLITNFSRVARGTDGAISAAGTFAGIIGAALIAIIGVPSLAISSRQMIAVLTAATAGLLFDSLLGATLERRGWLGNDLVNFASTCFAAVVIQLLAPNAFL